MDRYRNMEFSNAQRYIAKGIIKTGILRRHQEWQNEIATLIDSPYPDDSNTFDRNMEITKRARDFYKEAMRMEEFYNNSQIESAIVMLLRDGYLSHEELHGFSNEVSELLLAKSGSLSM